MMVVAVTLGLVLQLLLIYIPFFQNIFRTQALTVNQLLLTAVVSTIVFAVIEIYKWILRLREKS
jgi:Ca2+-transporting ATPase